MENASEKKQELQAPRRKLTREEVRFYSQPTENYKPYLARVKHSGGPYGAIETKLDQKAKEGIAYLRQQNHSYHESLTPTQQVGATMASLGTDRMSLEFVGTAITDAAVSTATYFASIPTVGYLANSMRAFLAPTIPTLPTNQDTPVQDSPAGSSKRQK